MSVKFNVEPVLQKIKKFVPQFERMGISGRHVQACDFTGFSQSGNADSIFCPGPQPSFMSGTKHYRHGLRPASYIERPNSFRPVELVR